MFIKYNILTDYRDLLINNFIFLDLYWYCWEIRILLDWYLINYYYCNFSIKQKLEAILYFFLNINTKVYNIKILTNLLFFFFIFNHFFQGWYTYRVLFILFYIRVRFGTLRIIWVTFYLLNLWFHLRSFWPFWIFLFTTIPFRFWRFLIWGRIIKQNIFILMHQ